MSLETDLVSLFTIANHPATKEAAAALWAAYMKAASNIGAEAWHEIGAGGEPAFTNSWVNFGSGNATAAFCRDAFGFVHLKGLVKDGTVNLSMFTLPVGYRPALTVNYGTVAGAGLGYLYVTSAGSVILLTGGSNLYVGLDVITFRAA